MSSVFDIPVEQLIPQRPPFVLVDGIIEHTHDKTISTFTIPDDHILVEEGMLSSYGLIEHMAQSAALRSGYEAHQKKEQPKTGFIGTISNAIIHQLPPVESTITTMVHQTSQILNFIVIDCKAYMKETLLAECSMKIVLMDET